MIVDASPILAPRREALRLTSNFKPCLLTKLSMSFTFYISYASLPCSCCVKSYAMMLAPEMDCVCMASDLADFTDPCQRAFAFEYLRCSSAPAPATPEYSSGCFPTRQRIQKFKRRNRVRTRTVATLLALRSARLGAAPARPEHSSGRVRKQTVAILLALRLARLGTAPARPERGSGRLLHKYVLARRALPAGRLCAFRAAERLSALPLYCSLSAKGLLTYFGVKPPSTRVRRRHFSQWVPTQ